MAYTKYETKKIGPAKLAVIAQANDICQEYADQGIPLTLRQLFYQFVARGHIDNKQSEYKRLGDICRDARMVGEMDWDHLIDLTRDLKPVSSWKGPDHLLSKSADYYHRDLWAPQAKRPEVWIEKDAAIGVVQGVCNRNSVPYFSCRGYTSMSEMHEAAQRIRYSIECGDQVQILHIGDHDPSGVDMSRDIEDRLRKFINQDWFGLHRDSVMDHRVGGTVTNGVIQESMRDHMQEVRDQHDISIPVGRPWGIKRIALTMGQVNQYQPPPNYAKESDSRYERYVDQTGQTDSWELDALSPDVMARLIQGEIDGMRDDDIWSESEREMEHEREVLKAIGDNFDQVKRFVEGLED